MSHYVRNPLIPGQGSKLVLGIRNMRNDVRVDTSALSELTRPAKQRTAPIIPGGEHEFRRADEVAKGLGLGSDQERDLTQAVTEWLAAPDVVAFRKSLIQGLRKMAPTDYALRSEVWRRTAQVWKATRSSYPSRVHGREGAAQDIVQKAEQMGLFGAPARPKPKPKKQIKGTHPVVGGWEAIPGGKHGGQRRRRGNRYEYRYPDGKGGWTSSPPKPKPKPKKPVVPKAKPAAKPAKPWKAGTRVTFGGEEYVFSGISHPKKPGVWKLLDPEDPEDIYAWAKEGKITGPVAEPPAPLPPPTAAPEKRSEGEVSDDLVVVREGKPEEPGEAIPPPPEEPDEPEEVAEPESGIIVVRKEKDPTTGKTKEVILNKDKHRSAHKHRDPQPPVKVEKVPAKLKVEPKPKAKPPKPPKPPKPAAERKPKTPSEPGWDRMPEMESDDHWKTLNGREKMDLASLEGARKGHRVMFTGADYVINFQDGTKSRFNNLDDLRDALLQSGKPEAKSGKSKTKGSGRGTRILGAVPGGPEADRPIDEGPSPGEGRQEAPGEEVSLVVEAESESHPPPIFDEVGIPYAERIPGSPAIKLHADLLPKIPDDVKLTEEIINFPVPAPLRDSKERITGHISKLFSHQQEAAERIRLAWEEGTGCLLQDEAGLGKTNAALAAIVANGGKRNLIVVPTQGKVGLKKQWMGDKGAGLYGITVKGAKVVTTQRGKEKLVNTFEDLSATEGGTYIVAYDDLLETVKDEAGNPVKVKVGKKLVTQKRIRPALLDGTWDTISFDECHNMKSMDSERADAAKTLMEKADKILYLSATPFENIKDMHYLTKLGLGFGNNIDEFAEWADKAGATVKGQSIKNPSSPLPMVALAAVMHVDGKSVKRITSMEGCTNAFSKLEMEALTAQQRDTFKKADEIIEMAGEAISGMTLKALYVGWARQYWETLKVPHAIEMGRKAREEGKQVAFFTSYKTANHEHLRAIPRMLQRKAERAEEKGQMSAATGYLQLASDINAIIEHEMEPPTHMIKALVDEFGGPRDVAEIHGATTKKPDQEQEAYQEGRKQVCVATMARGGTGISLHDTTGEAPRVQINLSLPWTGREYNQVAGRSHRLGSKSDTHMEWIVGDFPSEKDNAKRVSERLQSLGALTIGDPELTKEATNLASWDFAEDYGGAESDDPEAQVQALEELETAQADGTSVDTQTAAKAARLHFREYAELRAEGRDVIAERYKERKDRQKKQAVLEGRRAAEQLRQEFPRLDITYHPVLGVFEMDEDAHWSVPYGQQDTFRNALRTKKVGAEKKKHLRRQWLTGDGLRELSKKMGTDKTKVDMKALAAELKEPEGVARTVALFRGHQITAREADRGGRKIYLLGGNTAAYRNVMRENGLDWDRGLYAWPCPADKLETVLGVIDKEEKNKALAEHQILKGKKPPKLTRGTAKQKTWAKNERAKIIAGLMDVPDGSVKDKVVEIVLSQNDATWWLDNRWAFASYKLREAQEKIEQGHGEPWYMRKSWDGQLERLRPRLALRKTSHPLELVWMAEEIPDELHEAYKRLPPGWPHGDEILKAKYFKRTGEPGNYTYYYKTESGAVQVVSQKSRTAPRGKRGSYKKTRDKQGRTIYTGGEKPPEGGGKWEKIPESPHGGMRRPVTSGKVRTWEFWYPGGAAKQESLFDPSTGKTYAGAKEFAQEAAQRIREAARKEKPQLEMFKALLATGLFELRKARQHLYLKRVPTGKPKPKYRYFYKQPTRRGITSSEDIKRGAKFKVEHAGKLGHFEVVGHDRHNNVVSVKHDESGRVAHIREQDLHRMIAAHHARQTEKVTKPSPEQEAWETERGELRQRLATAEAKRRKAEEKPKKPEAKGPVKALPRASLQDLGKGGYDNIEGFAMDARDLEVQASLMKPSGREYAVIPQAGGGFVLASRFPVPKGAVKEAKGDKTQLLMRGSGGKALAKVETEYVVMEAADLIASHDPQSFEPWSAYPEGVQERRYEVHGSGDQGKIDRIAREMEPSMVINTNPDAINGAPMVTENGIVLGGNGRTMGMQRAYKLYPEKAQEMRDYLAQHARGFGVSPAEIGAMKQPVLVRRMKAAKEDMRALGRRMNEPLTQGMDPRTIEVALGQNYVTSELLDSLAHNMDADQSLSEFLRSTRSRPFVQALERAGVIDQYNKDEFVEKGTGTLNEDGRMRVERVLTARMIPDASVLSRMGTKLRQTIAKSVPSLIQMENAGWDIRGSLELAVRVDNDMRLKGMSGGTRPSRAAGGKKIKIPMSEHRESYMAQSQLFGEAAGEEDLVGQLRKDKTAQALLEVVQEKANKNMPSKWRQVALEADRQQHGSGEFGAFAPEKKSLEDSVRDAFELRGIEERGAQAGLFAMSLPPPDLLKAEDGPALTRYLMHAVIWEANNLVRRAMTAGEKPSGRDLLAKLRRFILEQSRADKRFAQGLGAHPLDAPTLKGLLRAAAMAHMTDLAKSLARASLWEGWRTHAC